MDDRMGRKFIEMLLPAFGLSPRLRLLPAAIFKFLFAALLIALAFAATYTSSTEPFSESDLKSILVLGGAVNAALLLGTLFFLRFKLKTTAILLLVALTSFVATAYILHAYADLYIVRNIFALGGAITAVLLLGALFSHRFNFMENVILSLVVLSGVATAYIIHTDLYLTGNRAVLILLCAGCGVGLFVAFRVIDELRWGGAALSAAALLGLGIVAGGHLATGDGPVSGDVTNIREVSFRETPNLYFVSFDAMAPRSLLDKYLDIETTEFHDVFEANFRRFPNLFADAVRTNHSLNSLLALDMDVYSSQLRELAERGDDSNLLLFSGQNPSPLLGILHQNGYETTSSYHNSYFGRQKGPYIDNYITFLDNTLCDLLDSGIGDISFWGYCRFFGGEQGNRKLMAGHYSEPLFVADHVTKISANDGPQFVIAHLWSPGHADRPFRYDDAAQLEEYRAFYLEGSKRAASYLELITRHLEENDPDAILFVYGDHGTLVSQGVKFEDNPGFVVQDHYGVLGGVYPHDTCTAWFDETSAQGYMTILDAVHTILRCLSGGESALIEPREYGINGRLPNDVLPWDANLDYREFLYE